MTEMISGAAVPAKRFEFVGGELCLDFCNTVGGHRSGVPREYLNSYGDLISWSEQAGLLDKRRADSLVKKSARHHTDAAVILSRAIELREATYRLFLDLAHSKSPRETDLNRLNRELARVLHRLRLAKGADGFSWEWDMEGEPLDYPLGPIARSAAELLASRGFGSHIHECGGQNCGWLFVDSSKNHSRRWCNMRDCGNRAKVRRHRLKQGKSGG